MARSTRSRRTATKDETDAGQEPDTPVPEKRSRRGRKVTDPPKDEESKEPESGVTEKKEEESTPPAEPEPKPRSRGRKKKDLTPPREEAAETVSSRKKGGRSVRTAKEANREDDEDKDSTDTQMIQDKDSGPEAQDTQDTTEEKGVVKESKQESIKAESEKVVDPKKEEPAKPIHSLPESIDVEDEKLDFEIEDELQFKAPKDGDIEDDSEKEQKVEIDETKLSALDEMLKKRQSRRPTSTTDKENKKDRWGKLAEKESRAQESVVTTESLKELRADIKTKDSFEESDEVESEQQDEARSKVISEETKTAKADEDELDLKRKARHISMGDEIKSSDTPKTNNGQTLKKTPSAGIALGTTNWDDLEANRRKQRDAATPPRHEPTVSLLVNNLVRPFTLGQLTDFVSHGGERVVVDLWLDKIKSKAIATFETADMTREAREELHNVVWPKGSPKTIKCEFLTEQEVEILRSGGLLETKHPEVSEKPERPLKTESKKEEKKKEVETNGKHEKSDLRKTLDSHSNKDSRRRSREEVESVSPSKRVREWDLPKMNTKSEEKPVAKPTEPVKEKKEGSTLETFFRKTDCIPPLYWLPLSEDDAAEKAKVREAKQKEEDRMKIKKTGPIRRF